MSLHYEEPYTVRVEKDYERNRTEVTVSMVGTLGMSEYAGFTLMAVAAKMLGIEQVVEFPYPKKVILNDPATVILWCDGTKTVTKCRGCDKYEPLFGIMACAIRKIGKNKILVDSWEDVLAFLADSIANADECRVLADTLNVTASALECGDTMESILLHYQDEDNSEHQEDANAGCQPLFHEEDGNLSITVEDEDERGEHDGPSITSLLRELFEGDEL